MPNSRVCGDHGQTAPQSSMPTIALCFPNNVHSLFFHLVFTKALGSRRVGGLLSALLPVSSGRQHGLPGTQMPSTAAVLKLRQKA